MKQMTSEVKQQLEWRRAQVLELASEGYTQREIAGKLQVDLAAVNRDIQFLRQQAKENLQTHIHEVVPEEYQKCMVGMRRNLKQTLEIAETAADPRTKLQARAIANDCYKYIMDLTTNGAIVTDAIKYVTQKTEQVNTLQKLDERIEAAKGEEETTINGIF
jgi:DNA-binding transcriptional regulator LsrR (DeoR family)